jgi:hypothetical protein
MQEIDFGQSLYWVTDVPEGEEEVAFDVYENYLESIVSLIREKYEDKFISSIATDTSKIKAGTLLSIDYIKRFLFLGWNTECLVKINDSLPDIELLRVNNQWKPIQVYYSIYSLCESTNYALTSQKKESHSGCLKSMSEYLSKHSFHPWSYAFNGYLGNSKTSRTITPINFSHNLIVPNSLKRQNISSEEVIACCLQAEHRNRIDDYRPQKKGPYKYITFPI